jgi:hypothetical protein
MPLDLCIGSLGWYIYQAREIEKHEGEEMKKAVKTKGNTVSQNPPSEAQVRVALEVLQGGGFAREIDEKATEPIAALRLRACAVINKFLEF